MPATDIDKRLDAFCAWLGRHGVPRPEDYRSLARGVYLLAGSGAEVGAEHVALSVAYARDSGADDQTLGTLEWLGERLLVFEQERRAQRRHVTGQVPAYAPSSGEAPGPSPESEPAAGLEPAPLAPREAFTDVVADPGQEDGGVDAPGAAGGSARKLSGAQPLAEFFDSESDGASAAAGAEQAETKSSDNERPDNEHPDNERPDSDDSELRLPDSAGDGADPAGAAAAGDHPTHRTAPGASSPASRLPVSVPVLVAGGVGLIGAVAVALWLMGADDRPAAATIRRPATRPAAASPPSSPTAGPEAASNLGTVPGLQLEMELLPRWHMAPPVAGRNPITAGAQLYRGESPDAPERTAWLSVLPLPAALTGAQITPETLAIIGRFVEDGLAEAMGDTYRREGCSPTAARVPTVVCIAAVAGDDEAASVRTYVRFDDFRALVAVFVTPATQAGSGAGASAQPSRGKADREADQIVAALRDATPDPTVASGKRK